MISVEKYIPARGQIIKILIIITLNKQTNKEKLIETKYIETKSRFLHVRVVKLHRAWRHVNKQPNYRCHIE